MIDAKVEAQAKLLKYAHVDTSLEGVPGDTKTVPSWNYIGDAEDFVRNQERIEASKLTEQRRHSLLSVQLRAYQYIRQQSIVV